jgi:hypothetical protein
MKHLKPYKKFKESLIIDLQFQDIDLKESLDIWHDTLLSSISAEEVDLFDTLFLPKEEFIDNLDIEFLENIVEFVNALTSLRLKKSELQNTDTIESFVNKPCKFMFIYGIESNELENPIYILFQVWNETQRKWSDVKLYKVNENVKKFYDKLSSKEIEVIDGDEKYIYVTSNGNDWLLKDEDKETDTYKKSLRKEELEKLLSERNVKISIV